MKTSPIMIALALGIGIASCNEKKENSNNDPTEIMEVDQENALGQAAIRDSTRTLADGTRMPVVIHLTDSINMPEELIRVIENTDDLHPDSILVKRRFIENGITYFELEFKMQGNRSQTFTFDEEGKRRSDDLDN